MEPLYPTAIVGYRQWRLFEGNLHAMGRGHMRWRPGINRAICDRGCDHNAPAHDCECGIYAWHDPQLMLSSLEPRHFVEGAVLAAGRTEIHSAGFRAERAQIIALHCPRLCSREAKQEIYRAAERFGVPVVRSRRKLRRLAERYGEPCPVRLRPNAQSGPKPLRGPARFGAGWYDIAPVLLTGGAVAVAWGFGLAEAIASARTWMISLCAGGAVGSWLSVLFPGDRLGRISMAIASSYVFALIGAGALISAAI